MKSREWQQYLKTQRKDQGKVLFTVTELANVAGTSRHAVNVELNRLCKQGVLLRYAHGLYGEPEGVTLDKLLPALDSHAYVTGLHALLLHHLVTQVPIEITCFTDQRSPRASLRRTPLGLLHMVCVQSRTYRPPASGILASAEQALLDFMYLLGRQGADPWSVVTFRNLETVSRVAIRELAKNYPAMVVRRVDELLEAD